MRITAALSILLLAAACISDFDGLGEAVGSILGEVIEITGRVVREDAGDLECAEEDPGYLPSLETIGPQRHYYGKLMNQTTIAGFVAIGDEFRHEIVAMYEGPPSRDVRASDLVLIEQNTAILVVRVVDANGNQRGRVGVRRSYRAKDSSANGITWSDDGEVRLEAGVATNKVSSAGCQAGWVKMHPNEMVWCTLSPTGLVVDERITRWQSMLRPWFP